MKTLVEGKHPECYKDTNEVKKTLQYTKGDRESAAQMYLDATLKECKNSEQRCVIKTVTSVLNAYYYGKYTPIITRESLQSTPVITKIGVPGAVKSWVSGKLRKWGDLRLNKDDPPYTSSQFAALCIEQSLDPVTENLQKSIKGLPEGIYGKSVALAFSGAAAGIIKWFTIHHGFSFPVSFNKRVREGEIPFPEFTNTARAKLLDLWGSVKILIIDEVYTLKVEWLSLIDEKLRQKKFFFESKHFIYSLRNVHSRETEQHYLNIFM